MVAARHKVCRGVGRAADAASAVGMSNPVDGVGKAPLFGGASGYKTVTNGRPNAINGSTPAFRGVTNKPGSSVSAPAIRTSYNRQDRGTNVLIPYARVVPLHHLTHIGRVQPGDVVFASTCRVNRTYSVADPRRDVDMKVDRVETQMRLVGIDWLNQQLGGRPEYDSGVGMPEGAFVDNWAVGETVILGAPFANAQNAQVNLGPQVVAGQGFDSPMWDPVRDNVCDEWRSLPILREWACDGIVLSNDEPNCHTGNGDRDGQLFNVGIQGMCHCNNGYGTLKAHSHDSHVRHACGEPAHALRGSPPRQTSLAIPNSCAPPLRAGSRLQGPRRRVGAPRLWRDQGRLQRRRRAVCAQHLQIVWRQFVPPSVPAPDVRSQAAAHGHAVRRPRVHQAPHGHR